MRVSPTRRRFVLSSAWLYPGWRPQDPPTWRATVPLVLAPTTVTNSRKEHVESLTANDFVLLDSGLETRAQVEENTMPLSLVLAVQATLDARKPLFRVREAVSLLEPLVVGEGGEAALIAVRDDVELVVAPTHEIGKIARAVRGMEAHGSGCSLVDAILRSAQLLGGRPANRRKAIVIVAESRDRGSTAALDEALFAVQKLSITVFALTFSPFLMEFARETSYAP